MKEFKSTATAMQHNVVAEKDSNSEHKNIDGGRVKKDGLESAMLIFATFDLTFLRIQKRLNQRQNTS